jgi:hypothetical protein
MITILGDFARFLGDFGRFWAIWAILRDFWAILDDFGRFPSKNGFNLEKQSIIDPYLSLKISIPSKKLHFLAKVFFKSYL